MNLINADAIWSGVAVDAILKDGAPVSEESSLRATWLAALESGFGGTLASNRLIRSVNPFGAEAPGMAPD